MTTREQWMCPRCGLEGDALRSPDPKRCLHCCRIDAANDLYEALAETLKVMRALRGLAFTGSRIPTESYPETAQANVADAKARAALARARGEKTP